MGETKTNARTNEQQGGGVKHRRLHEMVIFLSVFSVLLLYWTTYIAGMSTHSYAVMQQAYVSTTDEAAISNVSIVSSGIDQPVATAAAKGTASDKEEEENAKFVSDDACGTAQSCQEHFKSLLEKVTAAHQQMKTALEQQYGKEYYANIFEGIQSKWKTYGGFMPAPTEDEASSLERAKRKVQLKLLKDQIPPFIWVTGGNSVGAGHGNLFNESYTAVLESTVKDVFGSIGMDFEARNFATGGTTSAPEIALCNQAMFGFDYDILCWDYAITDTRKNLDKLKTYLYRSGMIPNRPIVIGIEFGGAQPTMDVFSHYANVGMASFVSDDDALKEMKEAYPNTFGISEVERLKLPPLVRDFKCNDNIEHGDPTCGDEKFTNFVCAKRKSRTRWHPGWKYHALQGTRMSLFVTQLLLDSLQNLIDQLATTDRPTLIKQLKEEEDARYETFQNSPLLAFNRYAKVEGLDLELILKTNGVCQLARIPSITRFKGILTNTGNVGTFALAGEEMYDKGILLSQAEQTLSDGVLRLVSPGAREECEVLLQPDYKDYFCMTGKDDWSKLTIPNDKEAEFFNYDKDNIKGHIVLCPLKCDNTNRCKKHIVSLIAPIAFESKQVEIKVNGSPVTNISVFDECVLLLGQNGAYFNKNSDGRFDIEFKLEAANSYMGLSAAVVF